MDLYEKLLSVSRLFRIEYEYLGYETIQMGNVNRTYKVNFMLPEGKPKSFLVQNVNTYAFRNPVGLMDNIDKVTEHIRAKKPGQLALHFHHTADRKTYVEDGSNFWRMTNYVPSVTFNTAKDMNIVRNAGKAFGEFQMDLHDFDITKLVETIPGFHNTRQRYEKLITSVKEDKAGRAAQVQEEIDFLMSVQDLACTLTDMQKAGDLPLRVTHNDTKINNVLFHPETNEAMIVIDLDTVMPGLIGHDFGDAIRFAANFVEEDCPDYEKVGVNLEVFRAFAEGFLSMTAKTMTEAEVKTLALSCFVLTAELATRFLADYLDGDLYFKVNSPDHNLVRTRCQIALAKDMLKSMDQMNAIVAECVANARV
ncbi:MAG: aminoglycoside phosphotransferase family protein [Oscillospiraceae bacterium]|nr:aminoglycoside phosphotransferase family protein [Oscillospiraceae bacterium]